MGCFYVSRLFLTVALSFDASLRNLNEEINMKMRVEDYAFLLCLNPLAIRVVMTRLINAIAQNEAKLRIPMETNMFHLFAPRKSPNIERGTAIPTSMDKASVVLKDPKGPLFTLLSLLLFPYKGSCNLLEGVQVYQ